MSVFAEKIFEINNQLSAFCNSLAGNSLLFDNFIALIVENDLLKAGIIGACFFAVWFGAEKISESRKVRETLLVTLFAVIAVVAVTRQISHSVLIPRQFVQTQKIYFLEKDRLIENQRADFRLPLDATSRKDHRELVSGDIDKNNLGSFPSDHAAFFVALALGIWFASKIPGLIALGWTLLLILPAKLVSGQHTPLDIIAGVLVGVVVLCAFQFSAKRLAGDFFAKLSAWTFEYKIFSSALIFFVVFELCNTFGNVRTLLKFTAAAGKYLAAG